MHFLRGSEARLVLSAARVTLDGATRAEVRRLLREVLDWNAVYILASYHGVLPLVWKQLAAFDLEGMPSGVKAQFEEESRGIALFNMRQALELEQIACALESAGTPALLFKGPLLAKMVYGDTSYRDSIDLDLLVHQSDFDRAVQVLEDQGYMSRLVDHTPQQRAEFVERMGSYDFDHSERGIAVELHWKFFPAFNAFDFDLGGIWDRHHRVPFIRSEVRTLAPEDLFVYLCIHGTKHYWMRLKWLCDVAEFLRTHPEMDWDVVWQRAEALSAQRVVRVTLLLVRDVRGETLPNTAAAEIDRDATARALAQQAAESWVLAMPNEPGPSLMTSFWFHMRERERWRERVPFALHNLRLMLSPSEKDRAFLRLPKALNLLYVLVRPLRIVLGK